MQLMRLAYTVKSPLEVEPCAWCGMVLDLGDEAFDQSGQGPYCSTLCGENDLRAVERLKAASSRIAFMKCPANR